MRVISGSARGRKLLAPAGMRVRPTADRVKEALFSIVVSRYGTLRDCTVLDLFAGTGNLGIEALSRGAAEAVFVDSHAESLDLLRRNLELTRFTPTSRVIGRNVAEAIRLLAAEKMSFDLVFLDPPYGKGLTEQALQELSAAGIVAPGGLVTAETAAPEILPLHFDALHLVDRRTYGDTALSFYSPQPEED